MKPILVQSEIAFTTIGWIPVKFGGKRNIDKWSIQIASKQHHAEILQRCFDLQILFLSIQT